MKRDEYSAERRGNQDGGFSLVEVALALGVAAFCLVTSVGLLPVGMASNQTSIRQTEAAGVANGIVADLRAAIVESGTASARYQIPTPGNNAAATHTLFLSEDGRALTTVDGAYPASASPAPMYRATVTFTPPTAAQRTATAVRLQITWPAAADTAVSQPPQHFTGSFETVLALDCN